MFEFELIPARASDPRIPAIWLELQELSASSFFVSWLPIRTWLELLPSDQKVYLLVGRSCGTGRPVLACMIGRGRFTRYLVVRGRGLHLNTTGQAERNFLFIEDNDFLVDPQTELGLLFQEALDFLDARAGKWNEFVLPGLSESSRLLQHLRKEPPPDKHLRILREWTSPYLNLDALRVGGVDYLQTLSANARYQLRRTLRTYQAEGELSCEVATTERAALEIFAELVDLHQRSWAERGQAGAFTSPAVIDYHRRLIKACLPEEQIQLMRVTVAAKTVACLYCFVFKGHVAFYQSGLAYEDDPRKRPGIVAHYLAIMHNLASGAETYDFLGGRSAQYKTSLATGSRSMVWCRLQRPQLRFALDRLVWRLRRWQTERTLQKAP